MGILDEEPGTLGYRNRRNPHYRDVGKVTEIIPERDIKAVVLAIDSNGSYRVARKILETRLRGVEVIDLPTLYEELACRLPLKHVEEQSARFRQRLQSHLQGIRAEMQTHRRFYVRGGRCFFCPCR